MMDRFFREGWQANRQVQQFGEDKAAKFEQMAVKFGVPDLVPLSKNMVMKYDRFTKERQVMVVVFCIKTPLMLY